MGGTLSYDFCHIVRNLLLQRDVDMNDHETWRTIFCTDMTDRDIKVYLNWNSVRLMRRNKPHNLAALIYRCMQQMAAFLDKATSPGSTVVHRQTMEKAKHDEEMADVKKKENNNNNNNNNSSSVSMGDTAAASSSNSHIAVDPCAVKNAIRILIQVLPCLYETEIIVEQTEKPAFLDMDDEDETVDPGEGMGDANNNNSKAATSGGNNNKNNNGNTKKKVVDELVDKLLALQESPFASSFAESFFKHNLTCNAKKPSLAFSPILAENANRAQQSGWNKENANPSSSTSILPVPLADELISLLTRLCFVPGFSVEFGSISTSSTMKYLRGYSSENAQCGYDVVSELLEAEGLFRSSTNSNTQSTTNNAMVPPTPTSENGNNNNTSQSSSTTKDSNDNNSNDSSYASRIYNTFFSFDVLHTRIDLLRCLQLCLSKNAMIGRSIIEDDSDWMRTCFQDSRRSPLSLTLIVSCLNFISTYVSRGVVPYSSHYFVDVPEKMLSTCIEFCCVAFAFPRHGAPSAANSTSSTSSSSSSVSPQERFLQAAHDSRHTLWTSLGRIFDSEPTVAPFVISGLCSILANPVYAATTTLRGSQRTIQTANEAVVLLWFLCTSPATQTVSLGVLSRAALESVDAPEKFGGAGVLMGLLRMVLRGLSERRFVADTQAALWVILQLTTQPDFIECLSKKIGKGGCPLPTLETLNNSASATQADALVLTLCEITCSSAPRWLLPLSQLSINILENVVPRVAKVLLSSTENSSALLEITQFELFHMLEWITSHQEKTSFLATQRTSVNQDACVVGMIDLVLAAAATAERKDKNFFKPLVASLATEIRISDRLAELMAMKNEKNENDNNNNNHETGGGDNQELETSSSADNKIITPYKPGAFFFANAVDTGKIDKFKKLEAIAVEKMTTVEDHSSGDPYFALDEAVPYFANEDDDDDASSPKTTSSSVLVLNLSDELLRWGIAHSWAMTIQSNLETPLLDVTRSKMFS